MTDILEPIKAKILRFPSQAIMFTLEEVKPLITTIESQQLEIEFALKTLNEIYDLRPSAEENYLHTLNECQHRAKHAANEIEWRRRNAK